MPEQITYYSTNNRDERVDFKTALLNGMGSNYGLYMVGRENIPRLSSDKITAMREMPYAEIAHEVLRPYLVNPLVDSQLEEILNKAYGDQEISPKIEHVVGGTYIQWLTGGPTYSFKDYAAIFFGAFLNYYLGEEGLRRTVLVATSGDTGGAVANALYGQGNIDNIVFFPRGEVSDGQRRQMTTLLKNIYAFEVNGNFDVCQDLVKRLLGDRQFAEEVFGDAARFTSANSISLGRLLPQAVYPFYAYSRIAGKGEKMIASIPSGNFGDMMGTVLAKEMGLPIEKIVCGVNNNREFPDFIKTGEYKVKQSKKAPSSAMNVSHPSNLARLIDFYGGHIYDDRDPETGKVRKQGVIDGMPDLAEMRKDLYSVSINNPGHYKVMRRVYEEYGVVLDPHGAVGWRALERYLEGKHDRLAVIYETADPGKFPLEVQQAIGIVPALPPGMEKQSELEERIYKINNEPERTKTGQKLSDQQLEEAKVKIREIFN